MEDPRMIWDQDISYSPRTEQLPLLERHQLLDSSTEMCILNSQSCMPGVQSKDHLSFEACQRTLWKKGGA